MQQTLQHAITIDDFELFTKLLNQKYVDVNERDWSGDTPLTFAASLGKINYVNALLNHNQENAQKTNKILINKAGSFGYTALHTAAIGRDPEIIILLLANNADSFSTGDTTLLPIEVLALKPGPFMQRPLPISDDFNNRRDSFFILLNAMYRQSTEKFTREFKNHLHETVDTMVSNWTVQLDCQQIGKDKREVMEADFEKFKKLANSCIAKSDVK